MKTEKEIKQTIESLERSMFSIDQILDRHPEIASETYNLGNGLTVTFAQANILINHQIETLKWALS